MPRPPRKKVPLEPAGTRANIGAVAATPSAKTSRPNTKAANIKPVRATPQAKKNNARGLPSSLPPSAMKVQHTPSFMSFTQRPRQGSILRMVQGEEAGEEDDAEGETTYFSLDLERSLSPESGKKRKSTEHRNETTDESSARKRRRSSRRQTEDVETTQSRRKSARNSSAADTPADAPAPLEVSESVEVQIPATNPDEGQQVQVQSHDTNPEEESLDATSHAEPSSVQEQARSPSLSPAPSNLTEDRDLTLDIATPSSPGTTFIKTAFTSTRRTGNRARRPVVQQKRLPRGTNLPIPRQPTPPVSEPEDAASPVSSPMSSPMAEAVTRRGNTKQKRTRQQQDQKKFMRTADLTALLPRRRGRGRYTEFEILDSDDIPEAEDSGAEEYGRAKDRSRAKATSKSKSASTAKGAGKKTYSRREAVDDEDEDDHDAGQENDSTVHEKSLEMEEAAKKFKDVDMWELSFESCDVGGEESSPWR